MNCIVVGTKKKARASNENREGMVHAYSVNSALDLYILNTE